MAYSTRYYPRGLSSDGLFPPGVRWLLIVNTSLWLVYFLAIRAGFEEIFQHFGLVPAQVVHTFALWQLFTYMFLHDPLGFGHILFNMLTLWMFGSMLEQDWGTRQFLKYYFLCGMAAGVCVLVVNIAIGDWSTPTIGASGAIFGLLLAFGVLYPNQTVLMNFLFPIKAKYMVMIYAAIELLLTFGPNTGVSTVAHLGGMVFGYVYLKVRWPRFSVGMAQMSQAYKQWKLQRAKRKFQVYLKKQGRGRGPWVN